MLDTQLQSLSPAPCILVVEDDPFVRDVLEIYLGNEGYRVVTAADGRQMRDRLAQHPVALVLMDVKLPGEDGFTLTRYLRDQHRVGIIIVTTRHDIVDKVVGLECGADDYIIKPFEEREVLARIRSVLRRVESRSANTLGERPAADARRLSFHGCKLDTDSSVIRTRGADHTLTGNECRLLAHLVRNAGQVQPRGDLMQSVLQRAWSPFDRSIDVLVTRLRQKIEADPRRPAIIKTVRGSGYLVPAEPPAAETAA